MLRYFFPIIFFAASCKPQESEEQSFLREAARAVPRDHFEVLDDPPMVDAKTAEERELVKSEEPVIGIVLGGEAKAYPIAVMGRHELINDTCGGEPIAVSW